MVKSFLETRSFIAITLICSIVFLSACSQTATIVTAIDTDNLVELDLTFGETLSTQAIPFEKGQAVVTRFEIQVFDERNTLVTFDEKNRINPQGSVDTLEVALNDRASIGLVAGDYSFKSKAFAPNKVVSKTGGGEVLLAVGTKAKTVSVDTKTIMLDVKTISESYTFQNSTPINYIMPGQTLDMMVVMKAPGGYQVPLADYDVSYKIDMNNIESHSESVRGVRLNIKESPVDTKLSVIANVTGFSADGSKLSLPTIDGLLDTPFLSSTTGLAYDTQAPSFSFTEPVLYSNQAAIFRGMASDNIGIAKVQVFDGPVLIGSSSSTDYADENVAAIKFNGNDWTMNFTPEERDYDLFAITYDSSGNQSSSSYTVTASPFNGKS